MRPGITLSGKILFLSVVLLAVFPHVSDARSSLTSPENIAALRERVAQGDMDAVHELGALLQDDDDPSNDIEGRDLLLRSAQAGASNSAYYLAKSYLFGLYAWSRRPDGEADSAEGMKWLRAAGEMRPADRDGQDIYRMLGDIYAGHIPEERMQITVPVDEVEAVRWYRLCAVELATVCEWRLGGLLLKAPETAVEGFKWLRAAAMAGNAWSQYDIAQLYQAGTVVKKNLTIALMWLEVSQLHNARLGGEATAMFDDTAFQIEELVKILPAAEVEKARKMAGMIVPVTKPAQ